MARLEYREGTSSKFYEVTMNGSAVVVRYGKIGTKGQEKVTPRWSPDGAKREFDKLLREKTSKGYKRVLPDDPAPDASPPNPEIEKAIVAAPDDVANYRVYGDWLLAQGEPRGELVNVQCDLAARPDDAGLKARERELLEAHGARWLGPHAGAGRAIGVAWRYGFVDAVTIGHDDCNTGADRPVDDWLLQFMQRPAARLVRAFAFGHYRNNACVSPYGSLVAALEQSPSLANLRRLVAASFTRDESELSWIDVGHLGDLWRRVPNLEELRIKAGAFSLGEVALPALRSASFVTGGLSRHALGSIARARWPTLRQLHVWFGRPNYGCDCDYTMVAPLLARSDLAELTDLGLVNCEFIDSVAWKIAGAPFAAQLESLDLSRGAMTDGAALAFAKDAASFPRLRALDVSENYLSPTGVNALVAAFPNAAVRADRQRDEALEGGRYAAVGE